MSYIEEAPEEWRPVVDYERFYLVSDRGRVMGIATRRNSRAGRVLQPCSGNRGYLGVRLYGDGPPQSVLVHRIVARAFLGAPPPGRGNVLHWNDEKHDNRIENLRWGSQVENRADAYRTGRQLLGEDCGGSKLVTSDIHEIRRLVNGNGVPKVEVAALYGVTPSTIGIICHGHNWRHVVTAYDEAPPKQHSVRGERHGSAKLNAEKIREIRALIAEGILSRQAIATRYGVSRSSIGFIASGRHWGHVT